LYDRELTITVSPVSLEGVLRFSKKDLRSLTLARWSSSLLEAVASSLRYKSSTDMCRRPCFFLFLLLLLLLYWTRSAVPTSPGSTEMLLLERPGTVRNFVVVGEFGLTGVIVRLRCSPSTSLLLILAMALGVRLFFLALEREKRIINVQGGVYSYIEVAQRVKLKIPVFEKKS
jgi:hypothetical protein